MLKGIFLTICLVASAFGQWDPNFAADRYGMVHLFEWHWDTIADECETLLAPNKVGGVQISPPTENRVVYQNGDRPWWERYQPISYGFTTRSGDVQALADMIDRCNAVGVRIYPDIVINHMCGEGGSGTGTGGSSFDANSGTLSFPAVPYGNNDFHPDCAINNYGNEWEVRNCWLVGLTDLDQSLDWVKDRIRGLMNDLIDMGVAGFRVDACKHMYPSDLGTIFGTLNNLRSDIFGAGKKAYIFQEVIDQGGEPITAGEYTGIGSVTEFKYGINLGNNKYSLHYLSNFGESWGMLDGYNALVFLNNHDNQRGHGGGGSIVTFEDPWDLKILTAYMLAWPYGVPRVMSSYYFSNSDQGPPAYQRSIESDGSCGNGWVCEHRWRQIKNMFAFSVAVLGTGVDNWWTNDNNQIAFSRGAKGFFAANNAGYNMNENLYTGLPDGSYCNVISGDFYDGKCAGQCVTVSGGYANIAISTADDPILAIHVDAMTSDCNVGGGSGGGQGTGNVPDTTCVDCTCADSEKVDCGELATTESSCIASGCLWCPLDTRENVPWCFFKASATTTTSPGGNSGGNGGSSGGVCNDCTCMDRTDCGELASTEETCTASGCLWCPLEDGSTQPWCFHPTGDSVTTQSTTTQGNGVTTSSPSSGSSGETCNDCACMDRTDCGELASTEESCTASGCLWCPLEDGSTQPWCFHPTGNVATGATTTQGNEVVTTTTTAGETCVDCDCPSHRKSDCGFIGIDMNGCNLKGCIWCEDPINSADPWCFVPLKMTRLRVACKYKHMDFAYQITCVEGLEVISTFPRTPTCRSTNTATIQEIPILSEAVTARIFYPIHHHIPDAKPRRFTIRVPPEPFSRLQRRRFLPWYGISKHSPE